MLDGSLAMIDQILMQGAAQGQTMFASSGDTGSFCSVGTPNGVPAGVPEVEYPAASPYAWRSAARRWSPRPPARTRAKSRGTRAAAA